MELVSERLQQAGINVETLEKGDYFSAENVNLAYRLISKTIDDQVERYERGELKADPFAWACQKVIEYVMKARMEMNRPVVCKCDNGGIRILGDAEATRYLSNQATAGLRKHKTKTSLLMRAIDASKLNDHERRELEAHQRRHSFILASHEGARRQVNGIQRKGLQLPDFTNDLGSK